MATFSSKFRKSKNLYSSAKSSTSSNSNAGKTTVEGRHLTMIQTFEEEHEKQLPQKKKLLAARQKHYEKLLTKKQNGKLESIEYTLLSNLKREIKSLEQEIKIMTDKLKENTYLLEVADILDEYETMSHSNSKSKNNASNKEGNILDFFSSPNPKPIQKIVPEKVIPKKKKEKGKITFFIDINDNDEKGKTDILDEIMTLTDKNYVSDKLQRERSLDCLCEVSDDSKIIFNFTTGTHICEGCGSQLTHFYDSQFTSYKESQEHDVPVDFPYVRMNHFNELIAQFQAKEQTDIPEKVFQDLQVEFKKLRIYNFSTLHYKIVKKTLQKLGHTNMYEHIPYIMHKFNGLPPPVLTLEDETKFRIMFKQIQEPFEKCKHLAKRDRKNFLSYSYVFYKFAELLGLDHLLICFRLLKSREKLFLQDRVWKAICEIKEWEFIPSL